MQKIECGINGTNTQSEVVPLRASQKQRTGGSTGIATLDPGARTGVVGQRHVPAALLRENDQVPIGCVYIYIYTHTHTHTYTCIYVCVCMPTALYIVLKYFSCTYTMQYGYSDTRL
jgi:hypothetical protein